MQSRISRTLSKRYFLLSIAAAAVLSAAILFGVSGCGHKATAKGEAVQTVEALPVVTTMPRVETIRRTILQPGFIRSYEETPIYAKIAGFLDKVNVDIGDKIKKDQLLGELWVPEVEENVRVKEAKIVQGEADVVQAKEARKVADANVLTWGAKEKEAAKGVEKATSEVNRWVNEVATDRQQYEKGTLEKQFVEEAENQLEAANATLGEAKAKWSFAKASLTESGAKRDRALADVQVCEEKLSVWKRECEEQKRWFEYARIKAPYDGVVTRRFVHTGHFVQPSNSGTTSKGSEPLFVVMRTDLMRVVIQVPEADATLIRDGADAIVRVQSLRNRPIPCHVTRSSWSLDVESRTLRVEIFLDNPLKDPTEQLQAGMYVNVSIVADLPDTMTLPIDAIITDGSKNYVFLAEDGVAKRVNVKLGVQNDRIVQLLYKQLPPPKEGEQGEWVKFTGKERVILSQLSTLKDGQAVSFK